MKNISAAIVAVFFLLLGDTAEARQQKDCSVSIEPSQRIVRLIYDPFETNLAPAFVTVVINNESDSKCQLALSLEGRGPRSQRLLVNGTSQLKYEVSRNGKILENDVGGPQVQLPLQSGKSDDTRIELRFRISSGAFVPAGEYSDTVILKLFQLGNGPPRQIAQETTLMVSAVVPARAQINVAGSNSQRFGANPAGSINFGELRAGSEREAFIQVRATSPVLLRISSENSGVMLHTVFGQRVEGVPYSLMVGNESVLLSSGSTQLNRDPARGLLPENYRALFRITDVTGRPAGVYKDTLLISVEPR